MKFTIITSFDVKTNALLGMSDNDFQSKTKKKTRKKQNINIKISKRIWGKCAVGKFTRKKQRNSALIAVLHLEVTV